MTHLHVKVNIASKGVFPLAYPQHRQALRVVDWGRNMNESNLRIEKEPVVI
jgi:hypothetical protein